MYPGSFAVKHLLPVMLLALGAACARKPLAIDKLQPCKSADGPTDAYCGQLEVFEDRAAQTGRKIPLKILVLPGMSRENAPDPLFYLEGGPGGAATKKARFIRESFRQVQRDRDIVLVDQRGTGGSGPLNCKFTGDEDDTLSPEEAEKRGAEKLKQCLAGYKADVRLYTTSIAMDDLDDVRAFLGYDRINLYGISYGTRASIEYVRRHGERVRSVVLDGVAPPDMRLPLYAARDGQRALELLLRDCARDAACNQRFPGLGERVNRTLARLRAKPEKIRVMHPRTGKEQQIEVRATMVAGVLFTAFYSSQVTSLIPLLIERAEAGDYRGLFALGAQGDGMEEFMSTGMQMSVLCAEDWPKIDNASIEREAAGTFMGPDIAKLRMKPCAYWPRNPVDAKFYEPLAADVPALIFSGEADPVTPPSWGEQIARQWKNSRHHVVTGIGHGTVETNGCVNRVASQFIKTASHNDLPTACLARVKRPPFFLGPAGPDPGVNAAKEGAKP